MNIRLRNLEPVDAMKRQAEHDDMARFMRYLTGDGSFDFPGSIPPKSMYVRQCWLNQYGNLGRAVAILLPFGQKEYQENPNFKKFRTYGGIWGEYALGQITVIVGERDTPVEVRFEPIPEDWKVIWREVEEGKR